MQDERNDKNNRTMTLQDKIVFSLTLTSRLGLRTPTEFVEKACCRKIEITDILDYLTRVVRHSIFIKLTN